MVGKYTFRHVIRLCLSAIAQYTKVELNLDTAVSKFNK